MKKHNLLLKLIKTVAVTTALTLLFLFAGCEAESTKEPTAAKQPETTTEATAAAITTAAEAAIKQPETTTRQPETTTKATEAVTDTVVETTKQPETTTPKPAEPPTTVYTTKYILNTSTMKFHRPACRTVKKMNEENKKEYNGDRNDIINMNYEPCKICNP